MAAILFAMPPAPALPVDRLAAVDGVEVARLTGRDIGRSGPRAPHRHDYHELIWVRAGSGEHRIDGRLVPVRPGTLTLIGRGQVHVFERAEALHAAVVRFGGELLLGGTAPSWLLTGAADRTVDVPPGDAGRLDALVEALAAELARPADRRSVDVQRHLLSVLLLWAERWYDASRTERRDADDAHVQLHRRFAAVLERDFARHHDAAHYAAALGVPPAVLSRALAHVTGRPTKALVLDRVLLEAARLLRFTDRPVGEVAFVAGYADPLYFSRAFKRRYGEAPMAYRERLQGRS